MTTREPSIKEELDRKTIETLEYLISKRETGEITQDQICTGLDVLFMNVNGLVDDDFINLITAADTEFCQEKK
jgi:hypothetical protein